MEESSVQVTERKLFHGNKLNLYVDNVVIFKMSTIYLYG